MENKVLKPKIRFKGFADTWEQRKLKDLVKNVGTGKSKYELSECNKYPVLGSRNIIGFDNSYDYWGDFILTARVGEYAGELYRYKGKAKITDNTVYLQGDNLNYLFYLLKNYNLKKLSFGSGQPLIKASELSNLDLKVTDNVREKEKISNLFINLDNLITLHQSKYDKLVNVKKALLEKMFPKDGKNVPEIRFKGFTDTWEQRKLDDIVDRYDNLRIPVAANLRIKGNTPYYGANGIQDHVKGYTHKGEFILVAEDGANDLKNYPVQYVNGYIWANNHVHVLQAKKEKANNKFIKYAISQTNIESLLVGGGRAKLNANIMMEIELKMPNNLQEQSSIGNIISKIDNLITLHQSKCFLKFDNNLNIELLGNSVSLQSL